MYRDNIRMLVKEKDYMLKYEWVDKRKSSFILKDLHRLIFNIKTISSNHKSMYMELSDSLSSGLIKELQKHNDVEHCFTALNNEIETIKSRDITDENIQLVKKCQDLIINDIIKFIKDTEKVNNKIKKYKEIVKQQLNKGNHTDGIVDGF